MLSYFFVIVCIRFSFLFVFIGIKFLDNWWCLICEWRSNERFWLVPRPIYLRWSVCVLKLGTFFLVFWDPVCSFCVNVSWNLFVKFVWNCTKACCIVCTFFNTFLFWLSIYFLRLIYFLIPLSIFHYEKSSKQETTLFQRCSAIINELHLCQVKTGQL